jgi:hypothetical protein
MTLDLRTISHALTSEVGHGLLELLLGPATLRAIGLAADASREHNRAWQLSELARQAREQGELAARDAAKHRIGGGLQAAAEADIAAQRSFTAAGDLLQHAERLQHAPDAVADDVLHGILRALGLAVAAREALGIVIRGPVPDPPAPLPPVPGPDPYPALAGGLHGLAERESHR